MPETLATPGLVIDAAELDAELMVIKARGQPHFTGGDMDAIALHFGKDFSELTFAELSTATAYVYLRRARVEGASWEMAANDVAVEWADENTAAMDPKSMRNSATSPRSAATGGSDPGTSTG